MRVVVAVGPQCATLDRLSIFRRCWQQLELATREAVRLSGHFTVCWHLGGSSNLCQGKGPDQSCHFGANFEMLVDSIITDMLDPVACNYIDACPWPNSV
jgi:hypothetical protein